MRNLAIKTILFSLLLTVSCQREKLDTVDGVISASVYMNNESIKVQMTDEGGEAVIEPRLATIADKDIQVTISVTDFFKEYNEKNNTEYQLLPTTEYQLYEKNNPNNSSTSGRLTVVIKKGDYSTKVGIKINGLDAEKYPFGVKYAIPIRITSSSAKRVLSDKDAVVTFDRPFKTDIVKIKKGYGLKINFGEDFPECKEFTIQAQLLYLDWASSNQSTIYGFGDYTRISPSGGIQVKDGGADGAVTWTNTPLEKGKWYQLTFAYKGLDLKVYLNGKLVKTFQRTYKGLTPGGGITLFNIGLGSSANKYVREVRVWSRELTEKEINDALYLPVNPESNGLVAYLPLDKKNQFNEVTKYANEVLFRKHTSRDPVELTDFEEGIEWLENVKFPAEGLEVEN